MVVCGLCYRRLAWIAADYLWMWAGFGARLRLKLIFVEAVVKKVDDFQRLD